MRSRRKFTHEYKKQAIQDVTDRGISLVQKAQEINIHPSLISHWKRTISEEAKYAAKLANQALNPKPQLDLKAVIKRIMTLERQSEDIAIELKKLYEIFTDIQVNHSRVAP